MENRWVMVLHLLFISILLVATTYTCLGAPNVTMTCYEQERQALLKFKRSVKDDSHMLSSWVGNDCCRWERVHCDGDTGNVVKLHLQPGVSPDSTMDWDMTYHECNYLVGNHLSSSLEELRHLKYLDLSGNNFQLSRIPEFIGSFKQLTYLNLSSANFGGNIPHHIGNLSNLKVLDLNSALWMADDLAWISRLSSLERLDLSGVDLNKAQNRHTVFYKSPLLRVLSLSGCRLYSIDLGPSLNSSRTLPNIKHLDLSYNYLQGKLPGFFQNMTSLTFLDLSSFNFSRGWNFGNFINMIPSVVTELHLSHCGLHMLHLSSPHLNFSTFSNIQYLDLSNNALEGRFPSVFTNMSSLRALDLSENGLNSSVPVIPNLLDLDLSGNEFNQIEHVGIWRQCHQHHLSR